MIENRYYVEPANWATDEPVLNPLRIAVFVEEQQVDRDQVWDGKDSQCTHVVARCSGDRSAIGTARISPEGKIGRMAVLPQWRGQGVGGALIVALIDQAKDRRLAQVYLHAQVNAIDFYQRHGFAAEGDEFMEAGIAHRKMRMHLPSAEPIKRVGEGLPVTERRSKLLTTESLIECRESTLAIMQQARHELCVYSRDLEALLYDQDPLIDQFRRIALSGPRARLRILVQDPARATHDGHRLVLLAQRLTTAISIRQPHPDDLEYNAAFICSDSTGYLYRSQADRFEGEGDLCNPLRCAELQRYFDAIWERALVINEFRRLSL